MCQPPYRCAVVHQQMFAEAVDDVAVYPFAGAGQAGAHFLREHFVP